MNAYLRAQVWALVCVCVGVWSCVCGHACVLHIERMKKERVEKEINEGQSK